MYNCLDLYRKDYKSGKHDIKKWEKEVDNIISLDEIEEFDFIHNELDKAVCKAYGWQHPVPEELILTSLLVLNQQRLQSKISDAHDDDSIDN